MRREHKRIGWDAACQEGGNQLPDNDSRMMNRNAPFSALLAMLIYVASFEPSAALGAPPSAPAYAGDHAHPWKLSCTNRIAGAFASAVTPIPRGPGGSTNAGTKLGGSPQLNEVVLRNGRVNSSFAAWKTSFGSGTNGAPQQCTLELHREPLTTVQYTLAGARPSKVVNGPNGDVSELVLAYDTISMKNLQVTP
jgi:hypothetical protein